MSDAWAIVSGGSRGLGRAFTERLVKLGYQVLVLYRSDASAAAEVAACFPDQVLTAQVDIRDGAATSAVISAQITERGAPDVLVNNAGINIDQPFLTMSAEQWSAVLDTNLTGTFHLTRAVAPAMVSRGRGNIINVGATTGMRPRLNGANYCASKAGLLQLTKCLALELAPAVRVNALIPGMTETAELIERYALRDPVQRAAVEAEIPQRRIASTDEIAAALEFLVAETSSYMTGQRLIIDGGQFMW
ncbi:MAG TPA: SDR family NAD(P)-dependent oxidoreductase [Jatrophihabitans sp.]|jgi:acetoacetyl-CoA reductase/3-oxoacyl-[acyl-carrier protein] reductase|uniref:SDR family NAD(P)-dependent oxidoreductase n=1 Tax=Jatrophihabitans sp. TaxID=1932789 RepID=UPI002F183082